MIRTRFAPSPTGYLHIGNTRIAIISWLFAKKKSGIFILRIDDTNKNEKNKKYKIKKIKEDLDQLKIIWDIKFNQSERNKRYKYLANEMIKTEKLYPCFETEDELYNKKNVQKKKEINI